MITIAGIVLGLLIMSVGYRMLKPSNDADPGQIGATFVIAIGTAIIIFSIVFGG